MLDEERDGGQVGVAICERYLHEQVKRVPNPGTPFRLFSVRNIPTRTYTYGVSSFSLGQHVGELGATTVGRHGPKGRG